MTKEILRLVNIAKEFHGVQVLDHINLQIYQNEFLTLLGPSGCGKTTLLRIIGGFESPSEGEVLFENECINMLPPFKRQINTVFQSYALFPHLNVFENIAFGLRIRKLDKQQISRKVMEALELVNLKGYEKRAISSLSGGQQQRIAIARAVVNEPKVLLLDEPLAALDLKLRIEMRTELKNLQQRLGITFVFVTHDQEEALTMSDTIVVMNNGKIAQIGKPTDIYNEPQNVFVADFVGASTILPGRFIHDYRVAFAGREFDCVDKGFAENEAVDVVIRPEDVKLVPSGEGMLEGVVTSVVFKGVHYEMRVQNASISWKVDSTLMEPVGSRVGINILPNDIHVMGRRSE